MTITVANIIPAKQAENAQTTQYTSTNAKTIIDSFKVCNTTGGAVTFSVNLVASGDAVGADNKFIDAKSIASGETYDCPELIGETLEAGDFISTLAGAATSLTIRSSGRQVT